MNLSYNRLDLGFSIWCFHPSARSSTTSRRGSQPYPPRRTLTWVRLLLPTNHIILRYKRRDSHRSRCRIGTTYRGRLNTTASQVLGPHSCHGVFLHSGCSGGDAIVVEYPECCEDVVTTRSMPMLASEVYDELSTAICRLRPSARSDSAGFLRQDRCDVVASLVLDEFA